MEPVYSIRPVSVSPRREKSTMATSMPSWEVPEIMPSTRISVAYRTGLGRG
jgi:hypothetical protein